MDLLSISPLGMLAAVVASMIIGFVWFSPMLFAPAWMKALGVSEKQMSSGMHWSTWPLVILTQVGFAFAISTLRAMTGVATVWETVTLVVLAYVTIYALPTLMNVRFGQKSLTAWMIEAGNILVTVVTQAVLISIL